MMTLATRTPMLRAVPLLALVAFMECTSAFAQQDRSFWPRPSVPAENTNRLDVRSEDASRPDSYRQDPSRLYADARVDLDAGQFAAAQRKLEVLVARFPASPLADVARRDLQRLYAGALGTPAPSGATPALRTIQVPDSQRSLAPVATQPPGPPTSGPLTATVPAASPLREASDDFRHLAGDRIFFGDSSMDLGGRAKTALEAQAAWLIRYPGIDIVVEGHSDDHGSRDFNRAIAEKRAYAVKLRLNDLGVSADRISIVAFGRDRPVADCAEPNCTAQNRRVVTTISRVPTGLTFDITRGPERPERSAGVPPR
jgi:peptidoglycan-associated lipoprotein